jgi:hypothetical protein
MRTCSVLGCQNPGSAFVIVGHGIADFLDLHVCTEHEAEIEAGARWDLLGDDMTLGRDMAPALEGWSLFPSMKTDGFTLILNTAGGGEPIEIYLTTAVARSLVIFLYPSSGLALPSEFVESVLEEDQELDW